MKPSDNGGVLVVVGLFVLAAAIVLGALFVDHPLGEKVAENIAPAPAEKPAEKVAEKPAEEAAA